MKKTSCVYYLCGIHKMCSSCSSRFCSTQECPLCKNRDTRLLEKITGRWHPTMNSFLPKQGGVDNHKESDCFISQSTPFSMTDDDCDCSLQSMSSIAEEKPLLSLRNIPSIAEEECACSLHTASSNVINESASMIKSSYSTADMLSPLVSITLY